MAKCKVCGSEFSGGKCPFCGTPYIVLKEPKPEVPKPENVEPKAMDAQSILVAIDKAKTDLVSQCRKSVVKVYCDMGSMVSTGSGFIIEGGLVVTNAHVVEPDSHIAPHVFIEYSDVLKLGSMARSEVSIVYYSRVDDIAILKPMNRIPSSVPGLKVSKDVTKQGEAVFTIGNPLHYKFTYMEGSVANPEYKKKDDESKYSYVQTTLTLNHGNSGGPVYDSEGKVIGMSTFGELTEDSETHEVTEIQGYGFCVSAKAINDAVKTVKK